MMVRRCDGCCVTKRSTPCKEPLAPLILSCHVINRQNQQRPSLAVSKTLNPTGRPQLTGPHRSHCIAGLTILSGLKSGSNEFQVSVTEVTAY